MLLVALVQVAVKQAGRIVVALAPDATARAVLAGQGQLKTTIAITYTPKGGEPRTILRSLTLRLKRRF